MTFKGSFIRKLLFALIAIILVAVGWQIIQYGFSKIQTLQQIERLPTSPIAATLPGEVKILAEVSNDKPTLTSEYFKQASVYYHYRYEEEETDSDGNTYWDTKFTRSNRQDFNLEDSTGKIKINIQSRLSDNSAFSLPISQQQTIGRSRHTEWRIEPGDQLLVLGWQTGVDSSAEVGFITSGLYQPLLSKYSEAEEKSDLGMLVIFMICGGIALIAIAALFLTMALGIHRLLAFLSILCLAAIIPLSQLGFSMLYQDIVTAHNNILKSETKVRQRLSSLLNSESLADSSWSEIIRSANYQSQIRVKKVQSKQSEYSNLSNEEIAKEVITNFTYVQERFRQQLDRFPNNVIATIYGVNPPSILDELPTNLSMRLQDKLQQFEQATTRGIVPYIIGGIGFIFCLGLTFLGFRLVRFKRHIENLPTSKTTGLVFGLSELKGRVTKVDKQAPLESPLTATQCYWYHYTVMEKRGSGKDAKWVTIEDRKDSAPFYCKDSFGQVMVFPEKAEMISRHTNSRRRGNRRYSETLIKLNDKVYLLGPACIDKVSGDKLVIREEDKAPFLISNYSEEQIMYRKANRGMLSLTFAFAGLMFSALFYLGINGSFSPSDYLIAALIAPIYMTFLMIVLHYNDLVFLKQRVSRNFSNIDVSLQKRANLLPNLEKVLKQYLAHEKDLFTKLSILRSALKDEKRDNNKIGKIIETEQSLLTQMIGLAEDYPDLKASSVSVKLMNKMVDLENEIALIREGFNDSVEYYNTRIETIPDVFIAKFFNFSSVDLLKFEAKKFQRVNFATNS